MSKSCLRSFLIFSLLTSLVLPGCKSKEETPPPVPVAISGELFSAKYTREISAGDIDTAWYGFARFYATPNADTTVFVNKVSVGDEDSLHIYSNQYVTGPGFRIDLTSPVRWKIDGANGIPSFSYDHSSPNPEYYGAVPISISRKEGVFMPINSANTSNTDSVTFVLDGGSSYSLIKTVAANSGDLRISPEVLAASVPKPRVCKLDLVLSKSVIVNIEGKNFRFVRQRVFQFEAGVQ